MGVMQVVKKVGTSVSTFTDKNAPSILTGIAITGTVATTALAVAATIKSYNDVFDRNEEDGFLENATTLDIIKTVWPNYIPTAISLGVTIFAECKACHEGNVRTAAATAAAEFFKDSARTYKQEVIEQVGKNKEKKIQAAVDKKQIEKNPPSKDIIEESLLPVNSMNMIFRDPMTGQYFISNMDKVERAAHKANADMRNDRVWLNDLLYDCGANMADIAREYYLDYNETGEIYVEDFVRPVKMEIQGHTVFVGTLDYTCKSRYD